MKATRALEQRRKAVLWDAVEERKAQEPVAYATTFAAAEAALETDEHMAGAEREIAKDVKRTFPWMESYASRESATRNVLLAYAFRNRAVGYCQSLNFIVGALLMAPLSEEDAFFSLVTIVEDLLPSDYYSRDDDLLGARIDQLVFAELLARALPALRGHLENLHVPLELFSLQWFMCLYAKDLPLALVLRVWDVMFVYGDHALFAIGLAMLAFAEARLLSCTTLEEVYEALKTLGYGLMQRDPHTAHKLVLAALDTLMRTPLVERVDEGRDRHRHEHHLQQLAAQARPAANSNPKPAADPSTPQPHARAQADHPPVNPTP
jgi:hypothetical protein